MFALFFLYALIIAVVIGAVVLVLKGPKEEDGPTAQIACTAGATASPQNILS